MNDFESLFEEPPKPRRKKGQPKDGLIPRITMTDCDCGSQLTDTIGEISDLFEKDERLLVLEFNDINQMPPNSALRIHDLLRQKPKGMTIIAKAHSPIMGPGVIVWLDADRRYIRSTAWLYFRAFHANGSRRSRPPWFDAADWWRPDENDARPNFTEMDYGTVLRLVDKHIPVKAFADKVLTPALLDEWGILDPALMKAAIPTGTIADAPPKDADEVVAEINNNLVLEKRVWFIQRKSNGRFTLKGGLPISLMAENPTLRETDVGIDFATKEELLQFLTKVQFCLLKDKVILDEGRVVME